MIDISEFQNIMVNKGLTKGEINYVFDTINTNKTEKINEFQYNQFYQIVVKGFIECDTDKDYFISKEELGDCL